MPAIRTAAAAAMLGVSPSTLRSWERRFGFPVPRRSEGGHRLFDLADIEALRAALAEAGGLATGVTLARDRGAGPPNDGRLREAIARFDQAACDRLLEESLAVRSLERTVEEVLLRAVDAVAEAGEGSPELGFAFRWATGWLAAANRLSPPAGRTDGILVFDGATSPEPDVLHGQALELCLRRRGVRVLVLSAGLQHDRLGRAVMAVRPRVIILSGASSSLDELGRAVFAARRAGAGDAQVVDFRGAMPDTGASTIARLPGTPVAAAADVLARLDAPVAVHDARQAM